MADKRKKIIEEQLHQTEEKLSKAKGNTEKDNARFWTVWIIRKALLK